MPLLTTQHYLTSFRKQQTWLSQRCASVSGSERRGWVLSKRSTFIRSEDLPFETCYKHTSIQREHFKTSGGGRIGVADSNTHARTLTHTRTEAKFPWPILNIWVTPLVSTDPLSATKSSGEGSDFQTDSPQLTENRASSRGWGDPGPQTRSSWKCSADWPLGLPPVRTEWKFRFQT